MRRAAVPFALFMLVIASAASAASAAVPTPGPTPTSTSSLGVPGQSAPSGESPPSPRPVGMTLLSQSAWNSPTRPLQIKVRVTNTAGPTLDGIALTLTIGFPARSRSVYEETLTQDPTGALFTTTFFQAGTIATGASRDFAIRLPLDTVGALSDRNLLYPLRIDLRANEAVQATLRTPMIYLVNPPSVALNLAWTFVLAEPMQVSPSGVFLPGPIEADIAPGGRIEAILAALDRPVPPPVDLAVSPVLVTELRAMSDGYRIERAGAGIQSVPAGTGGARDATVALAHLAALARSPQVELTALPFGDALLPAIQRAGFTDLNTLVELGRKEVATALSATPVSTVFRPPGSALDAASLASVVRDGVTTVLVNANFVPTQPNLPFSPPSVGALIVGEQSATAVLPDAGVLQLMSGHPDDPVLRAQMALGEMATRWLEFPNLSGRGVAILVPERSAVAAGTFGPLVSLISASPWLRPERVSAFVRDVPPDAGGQPVPAHRNRVFDPDYLGRLRSAHRQLDQFRITATGADASAVRTRLAGDLLTAEAGTFVASPALGLAYIARVDGPQGVIRRTYAQVSPPPDGRILTLPSRNGALPFTITNGSKYTLHVRVVIGGGDKRLRFTPNTLPHTGCCLTLPPNASVNEKQIHADAASTGRFVTFLRITTPGGERIASSKIVIRSTAYDRVALLITVGAGLFMAVWWGRGFLRRRQTSSTE
jgi:hypothetical protein